MRKKLGVLLFILLLTSICHLGALELRGALGKYYPKGDTVMIIDPGGNAALLGTRFTHFDPFIIHAGVKVNLLNNDTLSFSAGGIETGRIVRRLTATAAYAAGGVGVMLGEKSLSLYPYAMLGGGLMGVSSTVRWEWSDEYSKGPDTSLLSERVASYDYRPFVNAFVGIEVRFLNLGVFVQVDRFFCNPVDYEGVAIEGEEVPLTGGQIDPSGTTIYLGLSVR